MREAAHLAALEARIQRLEADAARDRRLILWALDGRTHWPTRGDLLVLRAIMPAQGELSADLRALGETRSDAARAADGRVE